MSSELREDVYANQLLTEYMNSLETAEDFHGEEQNFADMWEYNEEYFLPEQATEFLDNHLELSYQEIFESIDSDKFRKEHPKLKEDFKNYDKAVASENDDEIDAALEDIFFNENFVSDLEILELLGASPNN